MYAQVTLKFWIDPEVEGWLQWWGDEVRWYPSGQQSTEHLDPT
jgi:hypothetical protein